MKFLFRCDSSNVIGTGHIYRCINYINSYLNNEDTSLFVCRNFKNNISNFIHEHGHKTILLEYDFEPVLNDYTTWKGVSNDKEILDLHNIIKNENIDCIVFDHYGIDYNIEKEISNMGKKIVVITDIFTFNHYCDTLINYNTNDRLKLLSNSLKPNTEILCGIENVIINKKYKKYKLTDSNTIVKTKSFLNICIMMGGTDPKNYTQKVIENISSQLNNKVLSIVLGKLYLYEEQLIQYLEKNKIQYKIYNNLNVDQLIELYKNIDLCIGCLSVTAFERYFLGVKQICLQIVDNQTSDIFKTIDINELKNINIESYIKYSNTLTC